MFSMYIIITELIFSLNYSHIMQTKKQEKLRRRGASQIVCTLLCKASFVRHNVFESHTCYSCVSVVSFYRQYFTANSFGILLPPIFLMGFPGGSVIRNQPAKQETWIQSMGQEVPLEKEMATHSSILAWRIPMDRGVWRATVHEVAKSWT